MAQINSWARVLLHQYQSFSVCFWWNCNGTKLECWKCKYCLSTCIIYYIMVSLHPGTSTSCDASEKTLHS